MNRSTRTKRCTGLVNKRSNWRSRRKHPDKADANEDAAAILLRLDLERVSIGWTHPIDKNTLDSKSKSIFGRKTAYTFAENAQSHLDFAMVS
jgi:hypothetical protein